MIERGWLILGLLGLLGAMQAFCWLVARGLGRRLEPHAVALAIGLPLLLLAPWLVLPRLLFPGDFLRDFIPGAPEVPASDQHVLLNDVVFQLIPWELEVRHALKAGSLPFWSDLLEGGSSPWINPQAGVLSPLSIATRPVPIQYWLLAMLALKIQLAFLGTWLLARSLGIRRPASLLTAAGFSLSGGVMAWALFPLTAAIVWVPWLTVAVIGLFRERPCLRRIATTGALTAALLLSGHPETAAIGGLFAAVCGLGLRVRRRSLRASLGAAALAALLGFGLAAPQIVPFLAYLPLSQRAQETVAEERPELSGHHLTPWNPSTWFLPSSRAFLRAPVNPHAFGRPYQDEFSGPFSWPDATSGYGGLVAFSGAVLAAFGLRRRRVWPFLGFGIVGFLLVAELVPLAALIDRFDVLKLVCYRRFLGVSTLALAVAGGLGLDHWLRARRGRVLRLLPLLLAAALSLSCRLDPHVVAIWLSIGTAAGLAAWRRRWGAAALGAALLLDLVPWAWSLLPTGQPAYFFFRSPLIAQLQGEVSREGPWRAAGGDYTMYPSLLPVYGVADIRPHNPLAPVAYMTTLNAAFGFEASMSRYFAPLLRVDHPLMDFLNVRCVLLPDHRGPEGLQRIDPGGLPLELYRNPGALPRWFVPSRIDVIEADELTAWIEALDDGRRVAVFRDQREGTMPEPPAAHIRTLLAEPGRIVLAVTAPRETVMATSLQLPQGWSVRSAGQPLPKLLVNGAFLGVRIPRGDHRVELRFIPPGFVAGAALGGASLLTCGALLLWPSRRRGKRAFAPNRHLLE